MVVGINKFREHFAGHEDQYAIIGGAACELIFGAAGVAFRATKDIDMVLCVEAVDAAFGKSFSAFLAAGGYEARERGGAGRKEFHRFSGPSDKTFPHMIELFSRKPEALTLPETAHLTPIDVEDDVVSLSAILLDDIYYEALCAARREIEGVTILDETLLIPFKAKAFLDLTARKGAGEMIDSGDIKKHRNDVFRLLQLLPGDASIDVPTPLRSDLNAFVEAVGNDVSLDPKSFDVPLTREDAVSLIRSAYRLR
ncbi:MAG: hypothetical protein ABL957_03630 [Parvularculaceae bacterium]